MMKNKNVMHDFCKTVSVRKALRMASTLIFVIVLFSMTAITVFADMALFPTLELRVKNVPVGYYTLALLYYDNGKDMTEELKSKGVAYYVDGWYATYQRNSLHKSEKSTDDIDVFMFDQFDRPSNFKVIIFADDDEVYISDQIFTRGYNSCVNYDVAKGTLKEEIPSYKGIIREFAFTLPLTIIVELMVLKIRKDYEFNKRNVMVLIMTNILTQAGLYYFLNSMTICWLCLVGLFKYPINVFRLLIPCEIVIFVVEAIIFSIFFSPRKPSKAIKFSLIANLTTFLLGVVCSILIFMIFGHVTSGLNMWYVIIPAIIIYILIIIREDSK